ncbi:MAG: BF3164 family lipoprotein [Rikenellaceae bacterium]
MKKIRLLCILFLVLSCNNSNNKLNELFTESIDVSSENFIGMENLADPRNLLIIEDMLLICNEKKTPLIEIYDLSSKKIINSFLSLGQGNNEVLTVGNVQYDNQNKQLLVADLFKRKIFSYKVNDISKKIKFKPVVLYERGENSHLLFDKLYSNNDYLIAESRDPKGRIILMDKAGSEIGYYLDYPSKDIVDENLNDNHNSKLYASTITINPSLGKVALATYSAGMIDVCKIEKDSIVPIWNHTEFYPQGIMIVPMGDETAVAHTQKSRSGFKGISSSDNYVYALYSGKLLEDKTYPYGEVIYVASWDGKDTYKIKLDKSISRLAVDANDEYIYGITPEMDIVRFPIPKR